MIDLVKYLRAHMAPDRPCKRSEQDIACGQAADEIDRLNAQALELCAEISGLRRRVGEAETQNKHMRYALKAIADEVYDPWTNGAEAQRIAISALSTNSPEVSSELVVTVSAEPAPDLFASMGLPPAQFPDVSKPGFHRGGPGQGAIWYCDVCAWSEDWIAAHGHGPECGTTLTVPASEVTK